ncbi:MAG: NB-ARC domain-containing protein, partial [Microcystaceae cyanobacterium]
MLQEEFTKQFHQLTPKPRSVLILLLEGNQDEEIAREIGASEATVRKHIQNLCDHFEVPSEIAGIKKNRRQELIVLAAQYLPDLVKDRAVAVQQKRPSSPVPSVSRPSSFPEEPQDWGGAPDVSVFYGRIEEIEKLKKWILEDNCRLVALLGMAGMGKTTLSVKLSQEIADNFDYVIWRSLRQAPPLNQLLADLIRFLSRQSKPHLADNVDQNISQLIELLRHSRCLLILDNFDTILSRGDFAGHYQEAYRDYGQLLRRIGQEPHQSCLLITSLEKPREIALFEGETFSVRALQVEGLGKAAREILKAKGLSAEERWGILIKLYRGNPLALKMVASTIQELFGGNVADFLDLSLTGIVQDIIFLVEQQFERLSFLEKDIMYWLAIEQEPVAITQLRDSLPVPELELFTALKSLGERSLIEKGAGKFSLQPAVMEYV